MDSVRFRNPTMRVSPNEEKAQTKTAIVAKLRPRAKQSRPHVLILMFLRNGVHRTLDVLCTHCTLLDVAFPACFPLERLRTSRHLAKAAVRLEAGGQFKRKCRCVEGPLACF